VLRLVRWTQPRPGGNRAERGCARKGQAQRVRWLTDGLSYLPALVCLADVLRLVRWTQPRPAPVPGRSNVRRGKTVGTWQ